MTTGRNQFLGFLIKECSGLNYVFPKYILSEYSDLSANEKLEILIDKEDYSSLLYVISTGKGIRKIKTNRALYTQIIELDFYDHSHLTLNIKIDVERNGIVLMSAHEMLKSSVMTKENVKVPNACNQFEYIFISSLLGKKDVDDKYRTYFSKFNFDARSKIFAHISPKYNLVINLLDDLYSFHKSNHRKVESKIRLNKQNTGLRFVLNKTSFVSKFLLIFLVNKWGQLGDKWKRGDANRASAQEVRSLLDNKSILKTF